jgi:hypothetical protein
MIPKEFVNYQDKLYWIYRKVKQSQVKEGSVTDLKDFWMCDIVIKSRHNQDETLLFMRECSDATIVRDLV